MKLYTFPGSPNVRPVAMVVAHLGLELDEEIVDLSKGQTQSPEFLQINPNGRVPALVDGDLVLWESMAIIEYIVDKAREDGVEGAEALLPAPGKTRADISRWLYWRACDWMVACGVLTYENLVKKMFSGQDPDPVRVQQGLERFHKAAGTLNSHLDGRDFVVGEHLTLADIALASMLMYASPAQMPLGDYPVVQAWFDRIRALDSWKASSPRRG